MLCLEVCKIFITKRHTKNNLLCLHSQYYELQCNLLRQPLLCQNGIYISKENYQNHYKYHTKGSNVYWTLHHCNSWRMKDQLDVTCYLISLIMCSTFRKKTTDVVIHQHSCKLLKMGILMSETCWAHIKWNKIASDIKLVFHSSTVPKDSCREILRNMHIMTLYSQHIHGVPGGMCNTSGECSWC